MKGTNKLNLNHALLYKSGPTKLSPACEDRPPRYGNACPMWEKGAADNIQSASAYPLEELRAINALLLQAWEKEKGGAFTPLAGALNRIGKLIAALDTPSSSGESDVIRRLVATRLEQIASGALPFDDYTKDRLREAAKLVVSASERRHWVYAAAEAMRPFVAKVGDDGAYCYGMGTHLEGMLNHIRDDDFSPTKACRWLGWVQACCYMSGWISLEQAKEINKTAANSTDSRGV